MKHLRYLLMAALVAMPLTACDEDTNPVADVVVGTVTGTVSAGTTGLSGVAVNLVGGVSQSATTGAGGTYTFTNVPAGSYGISIDPSSQPDVSFSQVSRTTTITTNGETQTVDFSGSYIKTSTITGIVSASGAPLAGIAVTVTGGPEAISAGFVTNAGGEYFATGLRGGTYTVTIADVAGVTFAMTSASVTVGTGETKTAHFPGEAVQMAAISGAVTVDNVGTAGIAVAITGGAATETGPGGAYAFTNLTPGTYTVTITPPAEVVFETVAKDVTVGAGETGVVNFSGVGPQEPATISIESITTGAGVPVTLTAVAGQFEVNLNITRGDRDLDKVDVLIDGVVVATQSFAVAGAPVEAAAGDDEDISLSVASTQLRMGAITYVPVVFNGAANISANLYEVDAEAPIPTVDVPVIMANSDAMLTSDGALIPGVVTRLDPGFDPDVNTGVGLDWNTGGLMYDGPIYIAYSTTTQIPVWTDQAGVCGAGTGATAGTFDTGVTLSNTWTCALSEGQNAGPGLSLPTFTPATAGDAVGPDGSPVGTPTAWATLGAMFPLDGEDRYFVLSPTPLAATAPATFDVDNLGPTVTIAPVAFNALWDEWWVNPGMDLSSFVSLVDAGVGPDATTAQTLLYDAGVPVCGAVVVNADLLETNTSSAAVDAHIICGDGLDLLANVAQNNPVSNPFGKDGVSPAVYMLEDSPLFDALTVCTDPALDPFLNDVDNLFNIAAPFPVLAPVAGFGVEAIDDRSGFHKDDLLAPGGVGTGVGPVAQTVTRYYPDIAGTGTLNAVATGTGWLKMVMGNNHVRSSDFAGAETCMPHFVGALGEAGYFMWSGTVTDMAGNSATVSQDWAVDEVNIPVLANMVLDFGPYTAGMDGLFRFFATDDFEVDEVQVSLTYPTDLGQDAAIDTYELVYPASAVDAAQSPWDMDYPFDQLSPFDYMGGLLGQGIIGRIDFTDAAGATVAVYNTIDNPDVTMDPDALMEDDDFLPTAATGWIATDILGNGPSAGTVTQPFIGFDFGGWTNSTAAPWPAPGAGTIIEEWKLWDEAAVPVADPVDLVAQHKAPNSVFNPYFDAVALVHRDAANTTLTVCGEMSVVTQQDQGFNRFYRYALPVAAVLPDVCTTPVLGDAFHAAGIVLSADGAALLVTDPAVSIIVP